MKNGGTQHYYLLQSPLKLYDKHDLERSSMNTARCYLFSVVN